MSLISSMMAVVCNRPWWRRAGDRREVAAMATLHGEAFESRQLLAAHPIITEFMALNEGVVNDGDGNASDWIEIHNPSDSTIDLAGYRLTDKPDNLDRWIFPSLPLAPGEYVLVFASGQSVDDHVDRGGYLHTSFSLRASGEYLALVAPDGSIVSEFGAPGTEYAPQLPNVSYGLSQRIVLLTATSDAFYWVPTSDQFDSEWMQNGFPAAERGFLAGKAATGYADSPDSSHGFASEIVTSLPPRTHAVYQRTEFLVEDISRLSGLTLRMKYDDGFIAYLNGQEVARANAPEDPQWFSAATGRSRRDAEALEYVDFDLTDHLDTLVAGTNVLAIHGLHNLADNTLLLVPELVAAVTGPTSIVGYMPQPTPGQANVGDEGVFRGFVSQVELSAERGFHRQPFDLVMSTDTPGTSIRYTTDGSSPGPTTGNVYQEPIRIDASTTVRVAAFKDDFIPTKANTYTYLFLDDVIQQPSRPPGLPTTWDGIAQDPVPADYAMDPDVTESTAYRDDIRDGLLSIPTMSLVMDPEDLFGSRGIYINSGQRGSDWERATSVEIIPPNGTSFQTDSGIRIHGYSWRFHSNTPKHSFRLEFREQYGPKKLDYKLFPDAPVDRFDSIVLRAQGGRAWAGLQNPNEAQYIRDAFARDTARDMGKVDGHAAFVHLYLNGLYWGLYHAVERPDAQMGEEYFGGSDEDYDALNRRTTTNEAIDGDLDRYNEMLRLADGGLGTPEAYQEIQRYVDLDNLIDFFLIHQYTTNRDGPEIFQSNNQRAIGSRVGDPKFRFFVWDMEYSMWTATERININVDVPGSISHVYTKLRDNPEFRMRYADRAHQHLFHGGALTPEASALRWEARADEIYTAIVAESARWGDAKRSRPYTRDVEWQRERNRLLTEYFPQRTEVLIGQLRDAQLYPSVDAPVFSQHGGPIPRAFELTISNPAPQGTILYTQDGSDPRMPGGEVAPTAVTYDGRPIRLEQSSTVQARVLADGQWSALNQADFTVVGPDSPYHLRVTEINYHPHAANLVSGLGELPVDPEQFEFVELTNIGSQTVNLEGVQFARGIEFVFPPGSEVGPGQHVLVVRDQAAFESRFGAGRHVAGPFTGDLSNEGEVLEIRDATGNVIQAFRYEVDDGWPTRADGNGSSLEVIDPLDRYDDPSNWRSSVEFGGSPGMPGSRPEPAIRFSEVLAHSPSSTSDIVELYNPTDRPVEITDWYISNASDDYFKSQITEPMSIAAGGYGILAGDQLGLDLNWWRGDRLWLLEADPAGKPLRFVDHIQFGPSDEGVSLGRLAGETGTWLPLAEPTFGRRNSDFLVGDILITEVHYGPVDPDGDRRQFKAEQFEFVELYNRTDFTVDLTLWRLVGGVEMTFASGTTIPPHETLVVVPFDATSAAQASIFRVTLGVGPDVTLVGPYDGDLDDVGDSVRLQRAMLPPQQEPTLVPYLDVDQVRYGAAAPWPAELSGTGRSLHRVDPEGFGNFASSWGVDQANPGAVDLIFRQAGDANLDGVFDEQDIVQVLQRGKFMTGDPARWDDGDFNRDFIVDRLDIVAALQTGAYRAAAQAPP